MIFAGDFSTQNRLKDLKKVIIKNVDGSAFSFDDYAVVNFESPIGTGNGKIKKIGPNLANSVLSIKALKEVGVNLLTLANNHFRDYGDEGVTATISECNRLCVSHVGGGELTSAKQPLIIEDREVKIGIINVCENEFSSSTKEYSGSNGLDLIDVYNDIQELKGKTDYIVVVHHGGVEHFQLPTPRMKKLFRHLIDVGADIIINHHQHCYSGYERYKGKLIFYGLGNLMFDAPWGNVPDTWYYGYMVKLFFSENLDFKILPYCQCKKDPIVQLLEDNSFADRIGELNAIIADDERLDEEFGKFVIANKFPLSAMLPYHNHYLRALYHRGYLPDMMPENNKIEILNWARCESLHECLIKYLEIKLKV